MSGRFQLDPRAPAPKRAPAPPPPAPRAATAPLAPLAPPPSPLAAAPVAPARRNRRGLVIAAIVIALLLVGGTVAYVAVAETYPEKYILKPSQYPAGLSKARLTADEMDQLGIRSNPGDIDPNELDAYEGDSTPPTRGHALVLQDAGGARVVILALEYAEEDDAKAFARQGGRALCSFVGGVTLRDGDILVGILPEDGASRAQVQSVAQALLRKTSGLEEVCGVD